MAKEFNTEVTCDPKLHYMVDTTNKMKVFKRLIDRKKYFTINRARQFGKSTSLKWIYTHLNGEYLVVSLSFEDTEDSDWESPSTFYHFFCRYMIKAFQSDALTKDETNAKFWEEAQNFEKPGIKDLSDKITDFCKSVPKQVVVLIDEVDKSLNNQLFLNFLSMLRKKYIDRDKQGDNSTFWSVVLAGVYDIKSMKVKIRPEEEHKYNSPWNVAADYKLDMTFNPQEISTMLADYESENHIGFDINEISQEIYKYTSGYPVLVSGVCKEIEENLDRDWTKNGVQEAAKNIIAKKSNLSESMINNLAKYPKLKAFIRAVLMENFSIPLDVNNPTMDFANMFSIIKANKDGRVEIHNLIFQQILINHFISESNLNMLVPDSGMRPYLTKQGDLNMPLIINRFKDLMSKKTDKAEFLEREGRFMFICFLKPIINGTGFYYSEPENDDGSRMDLVITYNRKEYVIELKIWHGTEYELSGRDQLSEYLETRNLAEGYLVTFSFLKEKTVQAKPEWIDHNGKKIYEAVIDCGKE
jgi:hypothetical protein